MRRPLSTLGAFLRFSLQPAKGAWNLIGGGVGTIASIWLWVSHHPLAAGLVALSTAVVLLSVAGYRLQREKEGHEECDAQLDRLGYLLMEGENVKTGLVVMAELQQDPETVKRIDEDLRRQYPRWFGECVTFLATLGPDYGARFLSRSGLPPSSPPWPANLVLEGDGQLYEAVDHHCQRLLEFIKEIRNRK
jgi:hypothetical protein